MFPLTVGFDEKILISMRSDSPKGAQIIHDLKITYGRTILMVPAHTMFHARMRFPWMMRLALCFICKHDLQILFVAEAGARGRLKVVYSEEARCRPVLTAVDVAEIVGDLLEADGVGEWLRRRIQPKLLKELEKHWYDHETAGSSHPALK
jgi:hypothetical protein